MFRTDRQTALGTPNRLSGALYGKESGQILNDDVLPVKDNSGTRSTQELVRKFLPQPGVSEWEKWENFDSEPE